MVSLGMNLLASMIISHRLAATSDGERQEMSSSLPTGSNEKCWWLLIKGYFSSKVAWGNCQQELPQPPETSEEEPAQSTCVVTLPVSWIASDFNSEILPFQSTAFLINFKISVQSITVQPPSRMNKREVREQEVTALSSALEKPRKKARKLPRALNNGCCERD